MPLKQKEINIDQGILSSISGELDKYFKKIEKTFNVVLTLRDGSVKLSGTEGAVDSAEKVLIELSSLAQRGNEVSEQSVNYSIASAIEGLDSGLLEIDGDIIARTIQGKPIKPKTKGQKEYVDAIRKHMITFGLGPAGTGKTYLGMAMAISAFKAGEVNKIILTRPAIEAGEKLGFLPGDLQSKIDPYLRPLYDALYQIMGAESYQHNYDKGAIEVAPLAYMRGRTLDNAYIILDEAQNTTPAQMKMFLTRIGFSSKVIVTGDITQKDLPAGQTSGLDTALKVLKDVDEIAMVELTHKDVVRHPLVQKIVEAYEKYEKREDYKAKKKKSVVKQKLL